MHGGLVESATLLWNQGTNLRYLLPSCLFLLYSSLPPYHGSSIYTRRSSIWTFAPNSTSCLAEPHILTGTVVQLLFRVKFTHQTLCRVVWKPQTDPDFCKGLNSVVSRVWSFGITPLGGKTVSSLIASFYAIVH